MSDFVIGLVGCFVLYPLILAYGLCKRLLGKGA
jgi:hypothetical protein